ncbi:hypothetical protein J1605_020789 [Eschrichtius robustus]|uniref:Lysophosphatidylcholine acyltransferase 1 n=2 Tax=Eschrichtius robustus TaxID=9764 RepID=A0AB34HKQ3_ESCRO|nr:hypothetical protein J1605_020789 [Eschrichtius robustus]
MATRNYSCAPVPARDWFQDPRRPKSKDARVPYVRQSSAAALCVLGCGTADLEGRLPHRNEALGVSVTDYTFEDCQLALAEGQLRLPADTCLLEFARLVRGLGLKPEKLERDLDRHAESARMKRGGSLTLPKFAAQLEVPESEALEDLFALFDERGGGEMDMREYVVALSVVCRPSQTLDTIQLAFKMYGSQEDGSIDEHALSSILKTAVGVAELTVTDLFRAIDQEEKGRITFADFERFAEAYPDFAEEYLYPKQTRSQSCAQTPPAPTPNGFCADFSPEDSAAGTEAFRKKLD